MTPSSPGCLDLFGGRQSARSIHFISASLIVLFVIVHLIEVVLAGPINEVRSMLSGRYRIPRTFGKGAFLMASAKIITRRVAIAGGFAGAGWLVANATSLTANQSLDPRLPGGGGLDQDHPARAALSDRLAREYSAADISPVFKPNGTYNPGTDEYNRPCGEEFRRLAAEGGRAGVKSPVAVGRRHHAPAPPHPDHPA